MDTLTMEQYRDYLVTHIAGLHNPPQICRY